MRKRQLLGGDRCRNRSSLAVVSGAGIEIRDNAQATTQTTKTDRERGNRFFLAGHVRCTLTLTPDSFQRENRIGNIPLEHRGSVRRERECDEACA